jgi:hypothetical protein
VVAAAVVATGADGAVTSTAATCVMTTAGAGTPAATVPGVRMPFDITADDKTMTAASKTSLVPIARLLLLMLQVIATDHCLLPASLLNFLQPVSLRVLSLLCLISQCCRAVGQGVLADEV